MEPHNFLVRQVLHYDTDLRMNKQRLVQSWDSQQSHKYSQEEIGKR